MNDETNGAAVPGAESETLETEGKARGIVPELGNLPPGAVLTEAALAGFFGKHPKSIRRAVERGELPQPVRIMGCPSWTAGAVVRHIETRLAAAAKERERLTRKISELSA